MTTAVYVPEKLLKKLAKAGFKIIAREPTPEMVAAMAKHADETWRATAPLHEVDDAGAWRAAWDVAP